MMRNTFDDDFKKAQKMHSFITKIALTFIFFCFVAIFLYWGAILFVGVKALNAVNNTENIPQAIGKMVGEFEKARNESSK